MRTLLLTRGAPGAGKSTWIKNNHLEHYTLSPDDIRLMYSSPQLTKDGDFVISQDKDTLVWKTLFEILESRMENGEFTIIDATNSKTKDMTRYKELASSYRYKIYCVDFTDVPLEQCLKQNKMREPLKFVPENAIRNIYARFETQKVPTGIKVVSRDEALDIVKEEPFDLSQYEKIVHFGDIHGCYDTLMQYFEEHPFNDNYEYIFCGDYIDRGNQSGKTIKFLMSIMDKPNVCLLEGNHERSLFLFGNDVPSYSNEFEKKTKYNLINEGVTPKDARMFYRKLRQCSYYTYKDINVLCCHGGVPYIEENILYIPTRNLIKGVGQYEDVLDVVDTWVAKAPTNAYMIHGHRNVEQVETRVSDRVFNLEGGVEFGGKLRIVELNNDLTWNVIEYDNIQPQTEEEIEVENMVVDTVESAIKYLRENRNVQEKELGNNISSFNFTRDAFMKKNWNKQTILARGLFINTKTNEIVARSYEKFFRIGEMRDTELGMLKQKFVFPVKAYVKENGFLAIVSYNKEQDDLFVASKSTNKGDYVDYINAQLEPYRENILSLYRGAPEPHFSLVFECIDIENDPHIIKYANNKLVLLDAIYNDLKFKTMDYKYLVDIIGKGIGCPVKQLAYTFDNWDDFRNFYYQVTNEEELYMLNGEFIEGFVFVDANGFMTKCKSAYYNSWKHLRSISDQVLRTGNTRKTGSLQTPIENKFYAFLRKCFNNDRDKETKTYPYKTDIISLRDKFQEEL